MQARSEYLFAEVLQPAIKAAPQNGIRPDTTKEAWMMRFPCDSPGVYAIHIAGEVDKGWADCLGGLTIQHEEDHCGELVTILMGSLPDQAALYGVLNAQCNARYPLLFVRYLRPG